MAARWAISDHVPRWLFATVLWCLALLVMAGALWLLVRALGAVMSVTASVVAAVLLTALLNPVAQRLERLRFPAWLAALTTVLLTLGLVVAVGWLVVDQAVAQVDDLREAVRNALEDLQQLVLDSALPISQANLDTARGELVDRLPQLLPSPAASAVMAGEVLVAIALTLFLWFFFLKDGAAMWRWFTTWVPERRMATVDRVGQRAWDALSSYMRGTTIVALIDAVGIGAAMVALGVPLAASLSCIVFIGAFVPIVGAMVSGALAVAVTLVLLGPVEAALLFGAVILVQQLEGNLVQPLVMGRALHLHPVTIVVAVTVGALAGGVLGAVAAVPVVAVAYRIASDLRGPRPAPASPDANGAASASPGE